jgi:hypothetical protein
MDAVAAGFEVVLITEATLPVNPGEVARVLDRLRAARVVMTDETVLERVASQAEGTTPEPGVCLKAPEWAEHQRLEDDDLPCDDGRSGLT